MNIRQLSKRCLKWAVGAIISLGVVMTMLFIEPMRLRLPYCYLVQQFDLQRTGFIEFSMCMRVRLPPEEARSFVSRMFEPVSSIEGTEVDMFETQCDAPFWPAQFNVRTMAYEIDWTYQGHRMKAGTQGTVYQDGYLYFWSKSYYIELRIEAERRRHLTNVAKHLRDSWWSLLPNAAKKWVLRIVARDIPVAA